jgi:sugar phosphate isomerase/epimerase
MQIERRDAIKLTAAGALAFAASAVRAEAAEEPKTSLGIGSASYGYLLRQEPRGGAIDLRSPLGFLEFCHARGAGGIQIGLNVRDETQAARLRERAEELGMFVEGSLSTPRDKADVERFEADVKTARLCGATVIRTVMLGGRRYETFKTADEFRRFGADSLARLRLAEPVVARHGVKLAVENHKDFRADGLIELLRQIDSEHIGVCVDTGNNLALLEHPRETVELLAPFAVSAHLKDMAVEEYEGGFLLSEVPLGEGLLDLKRIVEMLKQANPKLRFSLEMITRDPLEIPCLTDAYWATFPDLPGEHLARTLSLVRRSKPSRPLPRTTGLSHEEHVAAEDNNVRQSLAYAHEKLGL